MKDLFPVILIPVFFLVFVLTVLLFSVGGDTASFKRQCADQGGHPYGTGLTLCLTNDGRVLEVYP